MTRNVEQVDLLEWLQKATAARRTSALLVVAAPQPRRSRARARGHAAPPTADLELTTRQAPAMVDQREAPPESVVPQSYPPSEPAAARRLRADEADDVSSAPSISPVVAPPPVKVTPRRRQVAGRARRPLVLAGCALGLAVAAAAGWMGTRDGDAGSETMPVSPVSEPECTAGDGSTDSAESAILGFEHGYYVTRNAEAARAFVAPSGRVAGPGEIQRGIDAVPEGTTWCVVASATSDPAVYAVDVREQRPGETRIYEQIVTTTVVDGKTLIEDIRHRGEHS